MSQTQLPAPSRRWQTPPSMHAFPSIPAPTQPPPPPPQVAAWPPRKSSATPSYPPPPPPPQHSPQYPLQGRRQTFPLATPPLRLDLLPLPVSNLWAQPALLSPPISPRGIQPLRILSKGIKPSPRAAREVALSFLHHLYEVALASAGACGGGVRTLAGAVGLRSRRPDFVADVLRLWFAVDAFLDGRNLSNEKWAVRTLGDVESVLEMVRKEEAGGGGGGEEEEEEGGEDWEEKRWECVMDVEDRTEGEVEEMWQHNSLFPLWTETFDAWNNPRPLWTEAF